MKYLVGTKLQHSAKYGGRGTEHITGRIVEITPEKHVVEWFDLPRLYHYYEDSFHNGVINGSITILEEPKAFIDEELFTI